MRDDRAGCQTLAAPSPVPLCWVAPPAPKPWFSENSSVHWKPDFNVISGRCPPSGRISVPTSMRGPLAALRHLSAYFSSETVMPAKAGTAVPAAVLSLSAWHTAGGSKRLNYLLGKAPPAPGLRMGWGWGSAQCTPLGLRTSRRHATRLSGSEEQPGVGHSFPTVTRTFLSGLKSSHPRTCVCSAPRAKEFA